jgi:hypothetical protein
MAPSGIASPRSIFLMLLIAGLGLAWLAWWNAHATLRRELRAITDCRGRYAAAHSFRDTAAVDMTYPSLHPQVKRTSPRRGFGTCGDLRLAGRLR